MKFESIPFSAILLRKHYSTDKIGMNIALAYSIVLFVIISLIFSLKFNS